MSIYDDWKAFVNSREGAAFLTFITTKNSKEIGLWLKKLGAAMASGHGVGALAAKAGVEIAGLGVAAYIAYQEVKRQWNETKKIWNKDDISGFEKIGRIALEAHPVTMTVRSIKEAWSWLTKSKREREGAQPAVPAGQTGKSVKLNDGYVSPESRNLEIKKGLDGRTIVRVPAVTKKESGRQVVEYERNKKDNQTPLKTTSDRKVEYMKKLKKNGNHPEWYTRFPEFVTTNLNYGVRKEAQYFPIAIGSRIMYVQSVPMKDGKISQAYIDQMNVLFAKLRGSNSGAFNYTTSDVMAYVECTRGIRILMHQIRKLIMSINNVDLYLAKTPDAFMQLMGLNAAGIADLKANRALYIAKFNQMAELIKANFPIAPNMSVYDRDKYIASVVLEDGKGPKSSLFTYITEQVFCASATAGKVEPKQVDPTSVYEMFRNLDTLINQAHGYVSATYSNYDTFAKIAGDMFKAYGNACLYGFETISLESKNAVQFDEYLLHQLQNAQIITYGSGSNLTWTANAVENITFSTAIYIPGSSSHTIPKTKLPGNAVAGCDPYVINTNKKDISGAESLSLTRGIWYFKEDNAITYNTNTTVEVDTCDTIVFKTMYLDYFDLNNNIQTIKVASTGFSIGATSALYQSLWAQVDYAPAIFRFDDSADAGDHYLVEDIDTYAYMTLDQYRAFTDTAVLSMYKTVDISDQVNFRAVKR